MVEHFLRDPRELHRGQPGKKIAGVCVALADRFQVSVTLVRAAFLLLLLPPLQLLSLYVYGVLWFVMPPGPGEESGLDRSLRMLRGFAERPDER